MAANLMEVKGRAALALAEKGGTAWHGMGTMLPEGMLRSKDVMPAAGLDWTVALQPHGRLRSDGMYIPSDKYSVVRLDPDNLDNEYELGTVGARYVPLQNAEAFEVMDGFLKDGVMTYETAGALGNGEIVFILARLGKEDFLVGGKDPITPYLLLATSHDGSTAVTVLPTPIRVVCANTLAMAMGSKKSGISLRHTTNMKARLDKAAEALGIASRKEQEMFTAFNKLAQIKATDEVIEKVADIVIPEPTDKASEDMRLRYQRERLELFTLQRAPSVQFAGMDNLWGVLNWATEFMEWEQRRNGMNIHNVSDTNVFKASIMKRTDYALNGDIAERRNEVFDRLMVGVS